MSSSSSSATIVPEQRRHRWHRRRPRSRWKRRLLARYLDYTEWFGYLFALVTLGAVLAACFWPVEDTVEATNVPLTVDSKTGALQVSATFTGETITRARVGSGATVSEIVAEGQNGFILRADVRAENKPPERVTARRLFDEATAGAVREALTGQPVRPEAKAKELLTVTQVGDIEITADIHARSSSATERSSDSSGNGIFADPPDTLRLAGKVVSGTHRVSLQVAQLPLSVREQVRAALAARTLSVPGGKDASSRALTVSDVDNVRIVASVTGEPRAGDPAGNGDALTGAGAQRSFEATIHLLDTPPDFVVEVKRLAKQGKTFKAKVSVQTGSRPLAWRLLKR